MRRFDEKRFALWLKETGKRRTADAVIEFVSMKNPDNKKEGDKITVYDLDDKMHKMDYDFLLLVGMKVLNDVDGQTLNVQASMKGEYTPKNFVTMITTIINDTLFEGAKDLQFPDMSDDLSTHIFLNGLKVTKETIERMQKRSVKENANSEA